MSTPFERAHLAILESHALPVRTHVRHESETATHGRQGYRPRWWVDRLRRRIWDLRKGGMKQADIAALLQVHPTCVSRHLRKRKERK